MSRRVSAGRSLLVGFLVSFFFSLIGGVIVGLIWDKKHGAYWKGVILAIAVWVIFAVLYFWLWLNLLSYRY